MPNAVLTHPLPLQYANCCSYPVCFLFQVLSFSSFDDLVEVFKSYFSCIYLHFNLSLSAAQSAQDLRGTLRRSPGLSLQLSQVSVLQILAAPASLKLQLHLLSSEVFIPLLQPGNSLNLGDCGANLLRFPYHRDYHSWLSDLPCLNTVVSFILFGFLF